MARKRTTGKKRISTRRKKGTNKKISSFYSFIKQTGKWGLILFICMIALLFAIECINTRKVHTPGITLSPQAEKEKEKKPESGKSTLFIMPEDAEIPRLLVKRYEQVIQNEGYTVSYNSDYRIANWAAYELTDEEVNNKNVERSNKFVPDPKVKGATAQSNDYTNSGFDRGHLAPAGDMRWSSKAMRESFYLSNICPQHPKLNRGIWKTLEEQTRVWALKYKEVYIATGPVIDEDMRTIGLNKVAVPDYFYKVICVVADNKPVGIGFLFENKDYKKTPLKSMVIPIDSVEKVTGIDFFYKIPYPFQEQMESKIEWKYWDFK